MAAPVFVDGTTPLDDDHFNALGALVDANTAAVANLGATKIDASSPRIPATPVVNGQWVKGVGGAAVWSAITPADVGLSKITASAAAAGPPVGAVDGDIWIITGVDANGTVWHFRYNAGSASAFKWEFIGGAPAFSTVATSETTNSAAFVDLATVGPSITLPRNGDYIFTWSVDSYNTIVGNAMMVGVFVSGGVQVDIRPVSDSAGAFVHRSTRSYRLNGQNAGLSKMQYAASGGTVTFSNRDLSVVPVRVS